MKLRNMLFCFVMAATVISCKEDKKETPEAGNAPLPETFEAKFNLVVPKDDTFQLYYTEDGTLNFSDDKSVKVVVKGGEQAQDVFFKLPADVVPTKIRLDFGSNPQQGNVKVNAMHLKYFDKTFDAAENVVPQYFYLSTDQISYDAATSSVKMLKKPGVVYDPLMWSNELLTDKITSITK